MRHHARVFSAASHLALAIVVTAATAAQAQTTVLFLDSQPGDYIGGGLQQTFTPLDGSFTASTTFNGGAQVNFSGPGHFWHLNFAPAQDQALVPGAYQGAQRFQSPTRPGLDVSGDGRGCNTLTGRFVVHELMTNLSGTVLKLAADFEQHCEGASPALFGSIRFNSSISIEPRIAVGSVRLLEGDAGFSEATFNVFLTHPATNAVSVDYATADGTAHAGIDYFAASGTVTFAPGAVDQTVPVFAVTNTTPQADRDFTLALMNATGVPIAFSPGSALILDDDGGRSLLYLDSQPFDFIGGSARRTLTVLDGTFTGTLTGGEAALRLQGQDLWQVHMEAPDGGPLLPGVYENATRWPFQAPGESGLDVSGAGRGCNMLTGRFVVQEVMAGGTGQLERFAADFEQHCEGGSAALFGSIRLNSAVPVTQQTPVVGDWNGDGRTDLLWRNVSTGANAALYMNGIQPSGADPLFPVADPAWEIVGTGDWNGNGRTDTLWRNRSTGQNAIVLMNGIVPTEVRMLPMEADPAQRIVATGRFNSDGWPDILWENETTRQRRVWFMSGTSVSGTAFLDPEPDPNWATVAAADFDYDGRTDVLWRNLVTGANRVWFLNGTTKKGESPLPPVSDTNLRVVAAGDFSRDGQADIVWRHGTSGLDAVWFMDGSRRSGFAFLPTVTDRNWRIVGPK